MMRIIKGVSGFSLAMLVWTVAFIWFTEQLGHTARLVPRPVVLVTLGLLVIQAVVELVPRFQARLANFDRLRIAGVERLNAQVRSEDAPDAPEQTSERQIWRTFAWFCALPVLVYLLGFLAAASLYTFLFMRWHAREGWLVSLLFASVMGGIAFGLFGFLPVAPADPIWNWFGIGG